MFKFIFHALLDISKNLFPSKVVSLPKFVPRVVPLGVFQP